MSKREDPWKPWMNLLRPNPQGYAVDVKYVLKSLEGYPPHVKNVAVAALSVARIRTEIAEEKRGQSPVPEKLALCFVFDRCNDCPVYDTEDACVDDELRITLSVVLKEYAECYAKFLEMEHA